MPAASGVSADLFFDFTTEGATCPHYWYNSTTYNSTADILTALGGTYSRAATTNGAWYTASTGLLASAGTNVMRFNYSPASTGPYLLLEPAATNVALWSRDLTQSGTWIATTMTTALTSVGADGVANSATRLTATAILATVCQTPGLSSAARTYTVFLRRVTGSGAIKITVDGSTYSSDLSGSLNNSTYVRSAIKATAVPIICIQIGTSGDAVDADFNQLETGSGVAIPTTPILTTSATVTRAADVLSWPTGFTGWSTTVGSIVGSITEYNDSMAGVLLAFSDGTTQNRIVANNSTNAGANTLQVVTSNVTQAGITVTLNSTAFTLNKIGDAWAANDFVAVANGGTPGTDASGTIPTVTTSYLGSAGTGTISASNIANTAYWGSRISNADLQTLTTP